MMADDDFGVNYRTYDAVINHQCTSQEESFLESLL